LAATPPITYTPRRGWTNAEGQFCREYKSNQGVGNRAIERYGTACRDASGQWRIVN
jgi:surface antigen